MNAKTVIAVGGPWACRVVAEQAYVDCMHIAGWQESLHPSANPCLSLLLHLLLQITRGSLVNRPHRSYMLQAGGRLGIGPQSSPNCGQGYSRQPAKGKAWRPSSTTHIVEWGRSAMTPILCNA